MYNVVQGGIVKRVVFILIFLSIVFSVAAHNFNGEWYLKFELNERYEKGVVFKDAVVEDDVVIIKNKEYEFKVLDDFYLIFDGKRYSYSSSETMIVLYRERDDYKFDRILFLKLYEE